jgi:hypothetical protein
MAEVTQALIARVGVDLSKRVYQVHAVDRGGRVVMAKALTVERFFAWCAQLPAGCMVAMEACGGAHHVARRLAAMGLDARLVAGQFITPYRMAGKTEGGGGLGQQERAHRVGSAHPGPGVSVFLCVRRFAELISL